MLAEQLVADGVVF